MKNGKKTMVLVGVAALLCLIVAGIIILMLNSDERKLTRQLQLGQRYLEEMDYEQAIVAFDEAIKIDPASVDAYLGLADAYIGLEDFDATVKILAEGYELTGSNEILQKLEELQGMNREAKIEEQVEDKKESETEDVIPYYELGFSPEDFTVAGYSVMDGNHIDDVLQAAAEIMPHEDDIAFNWENWEYEGWTYYTAELSGVHLGYHTPRFGKVYIPTVASYSQHVEGLVILVSVPPPSLDLLPANEISEIPLYRGPIIPGVTSLDESLDILGIRQLIPALEATESYENGEKRLEFESQYGAAHCSKIETVGENKHIEIFIYIGEDWWLWLSAEGNVIYWVRVQKNDMY